MSEKDYLKDALSLINRSEYEAARAVLIEGLKENPDDEKLLNLYSWVLFKLEQYEEMIEVYKKMVKINSQISFTMFFNLGKAYFNLGDYRSAIDAFIKTIELVPNHKNALFYLSACYEKMGDLKSSKKVLSNIISKNLSEDEKSKLSFQEGLEEYYLIDLLTSDNIKETPQSYSKINLYGSWSIVKDRFVLVEGKLNRESFIEHILLTGEGKVIVKGYNFVLYLSETENIWINCRYLTGIEGSFDVPFNKSNIMKFTGPKKIILPRLDYFIEDVEDKDIINKDDIFTLIGIDKLSVEENNVIIGKGKGRGIFLK